MAGSSSTYGAIHRRELQATQARDVLRLRAAMREALAYLNGDTPCGGDTPMSVYVHRLAVAARCLHEALEDVPAAQPTPTPPQVCLLEDLSLPYEKRSRRYVPSSSTVEACLRHGWITALPLNLTEAGHLVLRQTRHGVRT
jgi:hypothetical protein